MLELGSDLLGGGLPVNDVEDALRRLGAALGKPYVAVAAFPTGLFVTLAPGAGASFRPVGAPLRFEQTADILNLGRRVGGGTSTPATLFWPCGRSAARLPDGRSTTGSPS